MKNLIQIVTLTILLFGFSACKSDTTQDGKYEMGLENSLQNQDGKSMARKAGPPLSHQREQH